MGKVKAWALSGLVCFVGISCISREDQRWLENQYRGYPSRAQTGHLKSTDPLHGFIRSIADSATSQDNTIQGRRVRGVYSGEYGGCQHVAVLYLDVVSKRAIRTDDYQVCGSVITLLDGEVTPSYPDQPDARAALASAKRNGLLYGKQTASFQSYVIHTRRLGVASSRPCLPIETRIVYGGRLVLHDISEVCN